MSYNINIQLGQKVQKIRRKKGFTQDALAKKLGIVRPTLSLYESGKLNFSIDFLVLISKTLDVKFFDLLPDSLKQAHEENKLQSPNFDLDNDIKFTLELSLRHYLLRNKVDKALLDDLILEILTFIDKKIKDNYSKKNQ